MEGEIKSRLDDSLARPIDIAVLPSELPSRKAANKITPHACAVVLTRVLTKQGDAGKGGPMDYIVNGNMTAGFAILAYPAEYRNLGIMSFIIGEDGIVYEKDLGERTADVAVALTEYNPAEAWKPASE